MKIIDTHTHIYPDKIAGRIEADVSNNKHFPMAGHMTLSGLKDNMKVCGIQTSVAFCVAEKPAVVKSANDFIVSVTDNKEIIGFGTIVPGIDDVVAEVLRLKSHGIKGIKFNALFQESGAADESFFPVYEAMGADMVAYFHSGKDPARMEIPAKTTPRVLSDIKSRFPKLKIVGAHLGGFGMLDDVKKWILGKDIYIDTSWMPGTQALDKVVFTDIVKNHGIEKVLFATDYPTVLDPVEGIKWIQALPLTERQKAQIFHDNAAKLLNM